MRVYFDASPLFEMCWTGVSQVAKHLAIQFDQCDNVDLFFFYKKNILKKNVLIECLKKNAAPLLCAFGKNNYLYERALSKIDTDTHCCAFYPNTKDSPGFFKREFLYVHDITYLVCPEFHTDGTISHHSKRILTDIATSNHVFTNSRFTASELNLYLGVPFENLTIAYPGPDVTSIMPTRIKDRFITVLATIEPRKNIHILLKFLKNNPQYLNYLSLVIIGKKGWGTNLKDELASAQFPQGLLSKIIFTGYVTEQQKLNLLINSLFTIYPSIYEGFGMPVLESMAMGTPVLASCASSIKEIGLPNDLMFDPLSDFDFMNKFQYVYDCLIKDPQKWSNEVVAKSKNFTWEKTSTTIINTMKKFLNPETVQS